MSHQAGPRDTELRDRIESVISDWIIPGVPPAVAAQAIIDELGLTVEWQMVSRQIFPDGSARENPTQHRIVGKWEKK